MITVPFPPDCSDDEPYLWLRANCTPESFQGKIMFDRYTGFMAHVVEFEHDADAIAFRLRFGV